MLRSPRLFFGFVLAESTCSQPQRRVFWQLLTRANSPLPRKTVGPSTLSTSAILPACTANSSAEDVVQTYPHLSLYQVYAALAFYHGNRANIDARTKENHMATADTYTRVIHMTTEMVADRAVQRLAKKHGL
jgi:hypothetical protein